MELHGKNIIGAELSAAGSHTFQAVNPAGNTDIPPDFHQATDDEIDRAAVGARDAFADRGSPGHETVANLLEGVAAEIENLGDALLERANAETGLPAGRLTMERGRTCNQLRLFAEVVREGSWVEARIDRALPDREPLPKPDLRRMLIPIGPVAVFGASNFPLAFSAAGGDTASALAAGNPVIVKAHPAHPGTSELTATAMQKAVDSAGLPADWFSMIHGTEPAVSLALVRHPAVKAVGFTGSKQAGRALFDAAAARPEPIPVYAEMGSLNPVFVLPGALKAGIDKIAVGLQQSITLGVGQFCTNPGLVVGMHDDSLTELIGITAELIGETPAGTMLHRGILQAYGEGLDAMRQTEGVELIGQSSDTGSEEQTAATAAVLTTEAGTFKQNPSLSDEVFGPSTLVVQCRSRDELLDTARNLEGHLTATIHGSEADLEEFQDLIAVLEQKVGRLLFNGFPTGVEVCSSMNHGGPYPASTDVRTTSVGTAAIQRFARPLCYQNFPASRLPAELRDTNERNIWRMVDSDWTKDDV